MRITGSGAYNALLVPDVAVGTTQNERFLLVVNKDSVVETRPVILGALFGHLRAISSGLAKDERVVVDGLQFARAGSKVKAEDAQIPSSWVKAVDAETSDLSESAASPAAVSAAR